MSDEQLHVNTLYEIKRFQRGKIPPPLVLSYFQEAGALARRNQEKFQKDWMPHVERSKNAIRESMSGVIGDALVLGLGNGLEIPLTEMAEQFDSITAVEIDEQGARRTIEELSPELQEKVTLIVDDMSGALYDADRILRPVVDASPSYGIYQVNAAKVLEDIPSKPITFPKPFAFVSSSLIVSQLAATLLQQKEDEAILHTLTGRYMLPQEENYLNAASNLAYRLQCEHMEMLANAVQSKGTLYFADTIYQQYVARHPVTQVVSKVGEKERLMRGSIFGAELERAFDPIKEDSWFWSRQPAPYAQPYVTEGDEFQILAVTCIKK